MNGLFGFVLLCGGDGMWMGQAFYPCFYWCDGAPHDGLRRDLEFS